MRVTYFEQFFLPNIIHVTKLSCILFFQMTTVVQPGLNQAESTAKMVDQLVAKLNHIDSQVNGNETGILRENAKMKDEITYLIKTVKNQEDRIVEMEGEVQVCIFSKNFHPKKSSSKFYFLFLLPTI